MQKMNFQIRHLSPEKFSEQLSLVHRHLIDAKDHDEEMAYLDILRGYVRSITGKDV